MYALLKKIKQELKIKESLWKKIEISALTILSGVTKSVSVEVPWLWLSLSIPDPIETEKDWDFWEKRLLKEHEIWVDKIEEFKKDFNAAIQSWLGASKKLFIFIDDLDRCLPENTVKLIEAIKNFLSADNTLFVLAIDQRVISEMIEKKYNIHNWYGTEYLLKIIPYYFELPSIDLWKEIESILNSHGISAENEIGKIKNFFIDFVPEARAMKHYLHQIWITIHLKPNINTALSNKETSIHYIVIAFHLLRKFSIYFWNSVRERSHRLNGIGDNIRYKWKQTENRIEWIPQNELVNLEAIFKSIKEPAGGHEHLDIAKLEKTMDLLKQ